MIKWRECSLGDLVTFQRGHDLPKTKMTGCGYPVAGSNGVIGYHSEFTTVAPAITIGRSGNVGNPYIYYDNIWAHNTTLYIKSFHDVDPEFIYYFLRTLDLGNYAGGSAVPTLNRNHIHTLPVKVPYDTDVQKKIASTLKMLDSKIELNTNINKNLEQQAEAYYNELFIQNVDPCWKQGYLSDLGTIVAGGTPSKAKDEYYSETGIAWITPKDLSINKSKFISHGEVDISDLGYSKSSATKMPAGTVLFSSRAPIGYIAIAANEVTTNQGFKSVVPKEEIGTAFVYYFLKQATPLIESMASGSTFKEISGSGMKSVPAIIPDSSTVAKFDSFCKPIFEEQHYLEEENVKLGLLRDSLLPRLMSGDLDITELDL